MPLPSFVIPAQGVEADGVQRTGLCPYVTGIRYSVLSLLSCEWANLRMTVLVHFRLYIHGERLLSQEKMTLLVVQGQ